jgi:hypothetical protein
VRTCSVATLNPARAPPEITPDRFVALPDQMVQGAQTESRCHITGSTNWTENSNQSLSNCWRALFSASSSRCDGGLVPFWWSKPLKELRLATFNARVETVTTKPFFREPFKSRRCLMPVRAITSGKKRRVASSPGISQHVTGLRRSRSPGLWDEWKNRETGERLKSCAMIISGPNEFVAEVHDRMAVLLKPDQFEHWLRGKLGVEGRERLLATVGGFHADQQLEG